MNGTIIVFALFGLLCTINPEKTQSVHDFTVETIDGQEVNLSMYKGKKLLIVNTASKCGFTPQYEDLQKLHELYGDKVLVLGFPSNDFMGQEPGTNAEIAAFCQSNYGVTFPMFAKVNVKGKDQHPLFQWLSDEALNGWNDKSPSWNFCKYLVDEEGQLVGFYKSRINPLDEEILNAINE
jgi:glutathione peroxidase